MIENISSKVHPCIQKLNRECFWEYHMSNFEIIEMAQKGSSQEKFFLFGKIMENSSDVLKSLSVFSLSDQKAMVRRYNPPKFNYSFLGKRHKIIKYFLTGEKIDIPELRWNL